MLRHIRRLSLALTIAAACSLCAAAWAQADTKYDTSYANGGTLLLPTISGLYGQVPQVCEISGNHLKVAGRFGTYAPGLPGLWGTEQKLATTSIRLRPRQPMMLGIAEVRWHKQTIPTGQIVLGKDFDEDGAFAYVTRSQKKSLRTKLKLFRVLASGRRNAHFGHNGYISITIPGFDQLRPEAFRVIALKSGKVLVLAQTKDTQVLLRYTSAGKPDTTWGNSGVVELAAPTMYFGTPLETLDSATPTPDGGLLISANNLPGKASSGVLGVLKLTVHGKPDVEWADKGYWRAPTARPPSSSSKPYTATGQTLLTSIRKNNDFAVLYADATDGGEGTSSDLKLAYVDADSGVTTLYNEKAGSYFNGGDGGFPDANPWLLVESKSGTIFAHAQSFYENPGGTFLGEAARFSADADQQAATSKINNSGFATGAFTTDPRSTDLYFCGAQGVTSVKTRDADKREQRKAIALRRLAL
jgi:hypothetical protein